MWAVLVGTRQCFEKIQPLKASCAFFPHPWKKKKSCGDIIGWVSEIVATVMAAHRRWLSCSCDKGQNQMKLYNFENSESHILTAAMTHVLWRTNRNAATKDALIVWHQQSEHFWHNSDKEAKNLSTCPHSSPISLLLSCLNAHKCYDSKSLVLLNLHHFASPLRDRWATHGSKSFILFWNYKAIYALKLSVRLNSSC